MPAERRGSSPAQVLRNLVAGDLPLHRRLALMLRNWSLRVVRRDVCCGHPGEPGC